jgi:hypothetical protein
MTLEITPETMQRAEWRSRLMMFVIQNLKRGGGHQAIIDMISAGLASSGDRAYALGVAADALQELQRRNLRDAEEGQT